MFKTLKSLYWSSRFENLEKTKGLCYANAEFRLFLFNRILKLFKLTLNTGNLINGNRKSNAGF